VTPTLGVATATSINGLTINTTTGTLGIANGSTLATSGAYSVTLTTTGATNVTLPTSGTLANTAVTTLSSLSSVGTIGTGVWQGSTVAVGYGGTGITSFGTGVATALGNNVTGSGGIVLATSPMLVTPVLGSASATSVAMTSGSVNNAPVSSTDIANKAYVDAAVAGISVKNSCQEATTTALPANTYNNGTAGVGATLTANSTGVLTVDGIAVALNDRVLVKNEAAPANNGLYVCTTAGASGVAYVLTRSTDSNTSAEILGEFTFIEKGTANANTGWANTNTSAIIIGTTAINYSQFSGAGTYTAGTGLTLTGTQFTVSNTTVSANSYTLASLTVNAQGQLTAASSTSTTGSGSVVLATSPTLVTPALGTPSSATLTNATGLPISTGVIGLGTGVATALAATPTGSGSVVLATSPTLVTPALGAATATSINGATITSTTGGTLTLANSSSLVTSGAYSITLTSTAATNVTLPTSGTLVNTAVTTLSSLSSIGTVTTGTWSASTIAADKGGTGVANGASSTITLGGALTFSGAYTTTFTVGANTSLTLPASGTLVNSAVTALASLTSVGTIGTGVWQGTTVATGYGGTGLTSFTSGGAVYASSTSVLTTGTLPIASGGTNSTATPTSGGVGYGTGTAHAFSAAGSSGQALLSGGSGAPTWGTLGVSYGGTGVTTSTGSGNVVLSTSPTLVTPTLGAATITSVNGGQLAGMRNSIINGDMQIDQRNGGASQTFPAAGTIAYCVDRFYASCTGANVTGQQVAGPTGFQYAYRFTGAASVTGVLFGQRIESANCARLVSQNVTFSANIANSVLTTVTWTAYYANSTNSFSSKTQIATGTFTVSSTATTYSATFNAGANAANGIAVELTVGAQTSGTWNITGLQLELGSVATPFEWLLYSSQLSACLWYYQKYVSSLFTGTSGSAYPATCWNVGDATVANVPMIAPMRTSPTLTSTSSNVRFLASSGVIYPTITALSATSQGPITIDCFASGASTGAVGWFDSAGTISTNSEL